jgi:hypothetical protein
MNQKRFEYRICQVQYNRVTFVNGEWNGDVPPNHDKALETCHWVWDYLNKTGADGWQLSNALMMSESNNAQILYLAREIN